MNKRTELTEQDRQLLEEIEEIVANGGSERREADSLYGFCAYLASTVPQADEAFRRELEARLIARLQQQQEVRTLGTTSQDKGVARAPSWLQRLAPGVGRINQIFAGGLTMKRGFALAALAVLVIAVSTVAFVPSVRAQAGELVARWLRIELPGGGVAVSMSEDFTPLQPTYLPAGFQYSVVMDGGDSESFKLELHSDEQFVVITQTKAPANRFPPTGQEVSINGQKGVLTTGLKGTFEGGFPFRLQKEFIEHEDITEPIRIRAERVSIPYDNGKRLVWYVDDVRIEMLSNLSVEEMLKVAESMVPAEAGEGESPFGPPLNLPQGGER